MINAKTMIKTKTKTAIAIGLAVFSIGSLLAGLYLLYGASTIPSITVSRYSPTNPSKGKEYSPWHPGDMTVIKAVFSPASDQDKVVRVWRYLAGVTANPQPYVSATPAQLGATCSNGSCTLQGAWSKADLCDQMGMKDKRLMVDRIDLQENNNIAGIFGSYGDCSPITLGRYSKTDAEKGSQSKPWKAGDETVIEAYFSQSEWQNQAIKVFQNKEGSALSAPVITGTPAQLGASCSNGTCKLAGTWQKTDLCDRHGLTGVGKITDRIELAGDASKFATVTWYADCSSAAPPVTGSRCTNNGSYDFSGSFIEQSGINFSKVGGTVIAPGQGKGVLLRAVGKSNEPNSSHKIVYLSGNYYDRGYEHGYLLANEIVDLFSQYFYKAWFCNNSDAQGKLYTKYKSQLGKFSFTGTELQELQGMFDGIKSKRGNLNVTLPNKTAIDLQDLQMIQLEADWSQFLVREGKTLACAPIPGGACGTSATQQSTILKGQGLFCSADSFSGSYTANSGPVSWRSLDYPLTPEIHSSQNHTIFLVDSPEGGVDYAHILRPGSIGIATGFNQNGVFVALDSSSQKSPTSIGQIYGTRRPTQMYLRSILEKTSLTGITDVVQTNNKFASANVPTITDSTQMAVLEMGNWGTHTRLPMERLYKTMPQNSNFLHNVNSYLSSQTSQYFGGTSNDSQTLGNLYVTENGTLEDYVAKKGMGKINAKEAFNIWRGNVKNWRKFNSLDCNYKSSYGSSLLNLSFDSKARDFVAGFGSCQTSPEPIKPIYYKFNDLFTLAKSFQ